MIAAKYKILHPKYLVLIFFIMLGLSFASVPLYDLFCRVTGFGGTPQVTKKLPTIVANQLVTMRFDANAAGNLPVRFQVKNNKKIGRAQRLNSSHYHRSRMPSSA